ncbi:MAG: 4Fe-4S dicluster domain-containing protein [Candidatus Hodarchaeota archaeon]
MVYQIVNPQVFAQIKKLGAFDVSACMSCGLCTVSCPLSLTGNEFPRKLIRYATLGLDHKLLSHPEPWLCYYCGDCSKTCPANAEPGEFMMATRRYLTSRYDWTGLSKRFYLSKKWEFGALITLSLFFLLIFVIANVTGISTMKADNVSIDSFAPVELIHLADLLLGATLAILLLSNAFRMYYYIIIKDNSVKVPFKLFITEIKAYFFFAISALTQYRWSSCDNKFRWIKHLFLVTGYVTIFTLVMVFIDIFQVDDSRWDPSSILGYYGAVALLFVTFESMWSRYRKKEEVHKFSHTSDWIFLILLFLTSITGIMLHALRIMNLAYPSYILYVIHIMIAGPMLIVEVPFGKWSHMLYRPLAVYLSTVKAKAKILV